MAWRQTADDVLGRAFGKGNRGEAKVRCTSLSWKKFLLCGRQGSVSDARRTTPMLYARLCLQLAACRICGSGEAEASGMTDDVATCSDDSKDKHCQ